ncbi:MAG: AEC family transporter, partial [Candidatus Riflemargulisbacteria bacterium]
LIGLGALSRNRGIFQKGDVKVISSFVYYFCLPALFLVKISQIDFLGLEPMLVLGSFIPIFFVWILLILAFLYRVINRDVFILLSLSVVMGSNAFFGLAFFEFFQNGYHYQNAIITASLLGALGVFLSLLMFEFSQDKPSVSKVLRNLRKNPLLIAIVVGVFFSFIGFNESFLHSGFEMLGMAAGSIAVFSLGIFLYDNFSLEKAREAFYYSIFRFISLAVGVLLTLYILHFFYYESFMFDVQQFLLLQTAVPAAVSLVIFAERYNYKVSEITGIVILTSCLSFVFMILYYALSFVVF